MRVLAAALLMLAASSSCVNTDNALGNNLVPSNQDITIKTVEFDLPVDQRLSDSLQTTLSSQVVFGSINNGEYGVYNIGSAVSVTPMTDSIIWGGNPVVRDCYIRMPVSSSDFMSEDQKYIPQNVYVNLLQAPMDSTHVYNNSLPEKARKGENVCDGHYVYTGGDSLLIHFTAAFAEKFFKIGREALDSTELFVKEMPGLYFSTDPADQGTGSGRISTFDVSSAYLTLKYTSTTDQGYRRDTTAYFYLCNYQGLKTIDGGNKSLERDSAPDRIVYEGLTGVKPHIDGHKLRKMLDDWMKENDIDNEALLVAKATLEFPFEYSGDPEQFNNYPDNLYLSTRTRGTLYTIYSPIGEIYSEAYDKGSINRSLFCFKPDAALYMQTLIRKKLEDVTDQDDIWVIPNVTYTTSSGSSSYYNPYSYYDPYSYYGYGYSPYGYGGYGYSPYGYGGYGYSPYGYGYGYDYYGYMGTSSSSSDETYYYVDTSNYAFCILNGTAAERRPKLKITYTVLK
ncbi:MAG: hypothetical protein IKR30_06150 [Bacteroidales bacterium]|nr:hypothetical protein [Bacteroidales bacterium]